MFEKQWGSIIGNCDEFLYLGGNEQSTHKYVSELLGKATIDTNTYGESTGHSGNYSINWQISGRELLTPYEVQMLDNRYAILFVRGERSIMDDKYDILKHPNVLMKTDGEMPAYDHGSTDGVVASVSVTKINTKSIPETEIESVYELYPDEDIETLISNLKKDFNIIQRWSLSLPLFLQWE